ncbi:MAG: peptide chain release factor N(5)-glutamine methyltransferase [Bacteroidetes bacterium]|nr:MAG: peptide chain release factor N(5)-glutamine methyltransferase [Bacteroidota bacterium]
MKIKDLKSVFTTQLSEVYPSEEIESFFTILSEYFLNYTRLETVLNTDESLSEEIIENFENAISRLKRQEPIQYICGKTEFYSLPFKVDEHTLIPRPETEELVQWIIDDMNNECRESQTLLDIGTGSGCISIALARNLKDLKVSALDFSPEALEMAHKNSVLNGVKVIFFELDILNTQKLPQQYDIIVSNPPYVRELEKTHMGSNVLKYEPKSALLVADKDPLLYYRKIARLAYQHLARNGRLYFEINEYLSDELKELLETEGFASIEVRKDIFGKDRMIKCSVHE